MSLRARLVSINPPHIIRTIHRDTVLNANELRHLLPKKHLNTMFPRGAGVHFDFLHHDKIVLRPEQHAVAALNFTPMEFGSEYPLAFEDVRTLTIGEMPFRLEIFHSHFPG